MRRIGRTGCAAVVIMLGCVATTAGARGSEAAVRLCSAAGLKLTLGPWLEPMTQEQVDMFELTNRSGRSCAVDGYPSVSLSHGDTTLRFSYQRGGLYASDYDAIHRKQLVVLAPGHRAHFVVGKLSCDVGVLRTVSVIHVSVPGSTGKLALKFRPSEGSGLLEYCKQAAGAGPVNHVDVSRVEA